MTISPSCTKAACWDRDTGRHLSRPASHLYKTFIIAIPQIDVKIAMLTKKPPQGRVEYVTHQKITTTKLAECMTCVKSPSRTKSHWKTGLNNVENNSTSFVVDDPKSLFWVSWFSWSHKQCLGIHLLVWSIQTKDPAVIERMREAAGLNDPWYTQYFRWIGNALKGLWSKFHL